MNVYSCIMCTIYMCVCRCCWLLEKMVEKKNVENHIAHQRDVAYLNANNVIYFIDFSRSMLLSKAKCRVIKRFRCELILITGINICRFTIERSRRKKKLGAMTRKHHQTMPNDKLIGENGKIKVYYIYAHTQRKWDGKRNPLDRIT